MRSAATVTAIVCSRGRGKGCAHIDNATDLCPFCAHRGTHEPVERAEHDAMVATHARLTRSPRPESELHRAPLRSQSSPEASAEPCPRAGDKLYLLDLDGLVHRLYHAVPPELSPTGDPVPINAVLGLTRQLRKIRTQIDPTPRWALGVFDAASNGGWRAREYPAYKADRPPQDAALMSQWQLVRRLLDALGLPWVRSEGVEADDVIAAYTEAAASAGIEVVIITDDKDLLQLVDHPLGVVSVMSGFGDLELRGAEYVRGKYGVGPELLGDLLALAGDKVDGIPGCPGVGKKTAAKLLADHGDLEQLLGRWALVPGRRVSEALRDNAEAIRLGRRLIELRRVALPCPLDALRPWSTSRRALNEFFDELGFPRFEAAIDRYEP